MSQTDVLDILHTGIEKAKNDWWRSKQTAEMTEQDHALADLMGAANDSDVSPPKTKKLKTMFTPDRIKFSVLTEFGSNMLIEFEAL